MELWFAPTNRHAVDVVKCFKAVLYIQRFNETSKHSNVASFVQLLITQNCPIHVYSILCDSLTLVLRCTSHITHNGCYTVDHEVQAKTISVYLLEFRKAHNEECLLLCSIPSSHWCSFIQCCIGMYSCPVKHTTSLNHSTTNSMFHQDKDPCTSEGSEKQSTRSKKKARAAHYSESTKNTFNKKHVMTFSCLQ